MKSTETLVKAIAKLQILIDSSKNEKESYTNELKKALGEMKEALKVLESKDKKPKIVEEPIIEEPIKVEKVIIEEPKKVEPIEEVVEKPLIKEEVKVEEKVKEEKIDDDPFNINFDTSDFFASLDKTSDDFDKLLADLDKDLDKYKN